MPPLLPGHRGSSQPFYTAMISTRRTDEQYANMVVEAMTAAEEVRCIRSNQIFRAQDMARRLREELARVLASDPAGPESRPQRQLSFVSRKLITTSPKYKQIE